METINVTLRPAKMWDVFQDAKTKRLGQIFWVKSSKTGQFDNRGYIVQASTNAKELKAWVEKGMLYVPASDLEIRDHSRQVAVGSQRLAVSS